jgi:hypothetical protein
MKTTTNLSGQPVSQPPFEPSVTAKPVRSVREYQIVLLAKVNYSAGCYWRDRSQNQHKKQVLGRTRAAYLILTRWREFQINSYTIQRSIYVNKRTWTDDREIGTRVPAGVRIYFPQRPDLIFNGEAEIKDYMELFLHRITTILNAWNTKTTWMSQCSQNVHYTLARRHCLSAELQTSDTQTAQGQHY